jgi:hypothetical protein
LRLRTGCVLTFLFSSGGEAGTSVRGALRQEPFHDFDAKFVSRVRIFASLMRCIHGRYAASPTSEAI